MLLKFISHFIVTIVKSLLAENLFTGFFRISNQIYFPNFQNILIIIWGIKPTPFFLKLFSNISYISLQLLLILYILFTSYFNLVKYDFNFYTNTNGVLSPFFLYLAAVYQLPRKKNANLRQSLFLKIASLKISIRISDIFTTTLRKMYSIFLKIHFSE